MTRIAAVTGGTGFLGRHTARALIDAGWRVRLLCRRAPDLPELADAPLDLTLGDLGDDRALDAFCAGASAVIHIAGAVKARDRAGFMAVNADGAASVASAWRRRAPEAPFTLVSSLAARAPALSPYAASKRAGETRVAEIAGTGAWRALRPAAVYGAHDAESLKVLKLANAPVQLMLNDPEARIAMIDVRDAAAALAAFADRPGAGEIHELTDARTDGWRWRELAATAARALGRTPRPLRLPGAVLRVAGAAGDAYGALTGSASMLGAAKVREILHPDWSGDPALIPPAEVWTPQIALADGLGDMAAWARANGRL